MERLPKRYGGTRFRSFIKKISDTRIVMGMEIAKERNEFKSYGESILEKTR